MTHDTRKAITATPVLPESGPTGLVQFNAFLRSTSAGISVSVTSKPRTKHPIPPAKNVAAASPVATRVSTCSCPLVAAVLGSCVTAIVAPLFLIDWFQYQPDSGLVDRRGLGDQRT